MGSGSPAGLLQGSVKKTRGPAAFLAKNGLEILGNLQNFADMEFENKKV